MNDLIGLGEIIEESDINKMMQRAKDLSKARAESDSPLKVVYRCEKCQDKGWVQSEKSENAVRRCECFRVNYLKDCSGVGPNLQNATLDNYDTEIYTFDEERMIAAEAKQKCKGFANGYKKLIDQGKIGLYLYSIPNQIQGKDLPGVGSGKTHLAVATAYKLFEKEYINFFKIATSVEMLNAIKATWDKNTPGTPETVIKRFTDYELLIIDDLGTENPSQTEAEYFWEIINKRMEQKKITFFTSNHKPHDLIFPPRLKSKILSRITKIAALIKCPAEDIRNLENEQDQDSMANLLLSFADAD